MSLLDRWFPAGWATPAIHGGLRLERNKPGLPERGLPAQGLPEGDMPAIGLPECGLPECGLTASGGIRTLPLPVELCLPLLNYRRESLMPLVEVGQFVTCGQALAAGVIASASGHVLAIEPRPIPHPSGRHEPCVVIRPDSPAAQTDAVYPPLSLLTTERLEQCAVHGLGGAGFAMGEKLRAAGLPERGLDTLLINAVECEPLISCDEALVMVDAASVVAAVECLITLSRCRHCVIAIENDKHLAIAALRQALVPSSQSIELRLLAPVYPSGAERPLIERITGIRLKAGEHPVQRGIACINVATALAAERARLGHPMTSRIVTVAGESIPNPVNVRVSFGTSVRDLLHMTGNQAALDGKRVRVGGPLSGFVLDSLDAPITATTNCIDLRPAQAPRPASACIRCNACSDVCPVRLLPQQLHWYAQADDLAGCRRFGLMRCIECGCCDVVCPSQIPLTQLFRHARDAQRELEYQSSLASAAEERHQARELRLVRRKAEQEARRREVATQLSSTTDPIADALARARRRRRKPASNHPATGRPSPADDTSS